MVDTKKMAEHMLGAPVIGDIVRVTKEAWESIADCLSKSIYLPVGPGGTIFTLRYRTDDSLYIDPIKYVSVEIFKDMTIFRDNNSVEYHLGIDAFFSYDEAQEVLHKQEPTHE